MVFLQAQYTIELHGKQYLYTCGLAIHAVKGAPDTEDCKLVVRLQNATSKL